MFNRSAVLKGLREGLRALLRTPECRYKFDESALGMFNKLVRLRQPKNWASFSQAHLTNWAADMRSKSREVPEKWLERCGNLLLLLAEIPDRDVHLAKTMFHTLALPCQGETFESYCRRRLLFEVLENASHLPRDRSLPVDPELFTHRFEFSGSSAFDSKELTALVEDYFPSEVYERVGEEGDGMGKSSGSWFLEQGSHYYSLSITCTNYGGDSHHFLQVTITYQHSGN